MNSGYVKKLLEEHKQKLPLNEVAPSRKWPHLEDCVRLELLPYVDFALAKALLKNNPNQSEELAALICHLSHSSRLGHLCVSIKGTDITPDPRKSWQVNNGKENAGTTKESKELLNTIHNLIQQSSESSAAIDSIRRYEDLYYLQKFWAFEEMFLKTLEKIINEKPTLSFDNGTITQTTDQMVNSGHLLPTQAHAIIAACSHCLTILTGGPGTGKTYTAGHMVNLIWQNLTDPAKSKFQIALAAPTGKAAMNLQSSLAKSTRHVIDFPIIKATTLHALLGVNTLTKDLNHAKKLSADLVLIDECSMIDVRLMTLLFSSLKPGSRLILLGDQYQLPSIEAGSLFSDLVRLFESNNSSSLTALETCMRAERKELVQFANAIKEGNLSVATAFLSEREPDKPVSRAVFEPSFFYAELLAYAKPFFTPNLTMEPLLLLEEFNRFRILSPLRQGSFGTEELNRFFDKNLNSKAVPIMLLQNDYRLDLFNGEIGILLRTLDGDYAIFPSRTQDVPYRRLAAVLLPKYEPAYCISIHKSQGSEFDHVLMLVPKGSEQFGREVFYTAATRARQKLTVWGDESEINKTLTNQSYRQSGIIEKSKRSLVRGF